MKPVRQVRNDIYLYTTSPLRQIGIGGIFSRFYLDVLWAEHLVVVNAMLMPEGQLHPWNQ